MRTTRPDLDPVAGEHQGEAINRRAVMKPSWGLWTSTLQAGGSAAWADWCRAESFGTVDAEYWHLLTPSPAARVLVMACLADYIAVVRRWPHPLPWRMTEREIDWAGIIAAGYDAVRLTDDGAATCRLPSAVPDDVSLMALYAWDCESTVWLQWAFIEDESTVIREPQANRAP